MKGYEEPKVAMEQPEQKMNEAKERERFGSLNKVKELCKDFGFTVEMLRGAMAECRKNNV